MQQEAASCELNLGGSSRKAGAWVTQLPDHILTPLSSVPAFACLCHVQVDCSAGSTPLHLAAASGSVRTVKSIMSAYVRGCFSTVKQASVLLRVCSGMRT